MAAASELKLSAEAKSAVDILIREIFKNEAIRHQDIVRWNVSVSVFAGDMTITIQLPGVEFNDDEVG